MYKSSRIISNLFVLSGFWEQYSNENGQLSYNTCIGPKFMYMHSSYLWPFDKDIKGWEEFILVR